MARHLPQARRLVWLAWQRGSRRICLFYPQGDERERICRKMTVFTFKDLIFNLFLSISYTWMNGNTSDRDRYNCSITHLQQWGNLSSWQAQWQACPHKFHRICMLLTLYRKRSSLSRWWPASLIEGDTRLRLEFLRDFWRITSGSNTNLWACLEGESRLSWSLLGGDTKRRPGENRLWGDIFLGTSRCGDWRPGMRRPREKYI